MPISADYFVVVVYLVAVVGVSFYNRSRSLSDMFVSKKLIPWWLASASLLMFWWNPAYDMMMMGVLVDKGYSGTWVLHSKLLLAGIAPIVFAPLWAKLRFMTDNQFILFRFSGRGATILHQFRAVYVGFFVVIFLVSFGMIGLNKLWPLLLSVSYEQAQGLTFLLLALAITKNAFKQKVRTDAINAVLYLITPLIGCVFILQKFGGVNQVLARLQAEFPEKVALVPNASSVMGGESLSNFLVFVLVQWWSVNILDSSGIEAQRYMSTRNGWAAFRAAFLPVLVIAVMSIFVGLIQDALLLQHLTQNPAADTEAMYLESFISYLPPGFRALAVLAFLMGFVTTIEAFLNWGASLLVVDAYRTYWQPQRTDAHYRWITYLAMYLILGASALVVLYNDYMLGIQKFIFSISAGVGPVFVLRWFWWRVNAWAQLSAMLGSLVLTLTFNFSYEHWTIFQDLIQSAQTSLQLDYYPLKLTILTMLVTLLWITVMYLTPPDSSAHLQKFVQQVQPGGWWPKQWKTNRLKLSSKLRLIAIYATISVLPIFLIWEFKFGQWWVGIGLVALFTTLIFYTLNKMRANHQA